jgi:hypothetical protein
MAESSMSLTCAKFSPFLGLSRGDSQDGPPFTHLSTYIRSPSAELWCSPGRSVLGMVEKPDGLC